MKLTVILLTTVLLQAAATGYTQTVTISVKDAPLEKVFAEIKKQTGFNFFYNLKILNTAGKVSVTVSGASLEEVMNRCLEGQPLTWMLVENVVVIKEKDKTDPKKESHLEQPLLALLTIKGRVLNEAGEPVGSASVTVKGTTKGTVSNAEGYFELNDVDENAAIIISSINIETIEIKIAGRVDLGNLTVKTKVVEVETIEIRSTGYWVGDKKNNLGNIEKVSAKEIKNQPVGNVLQAVIGRMSGVEIVQRSGVPGGMNDIRIRGLNSLRISDEANRPLYVIDGVPFLSTPVRSQGVNTLYGTDPLATLNPESIESIEVLKDADATAIYGSRGANGVVLITTKKGKNLNGKTSVEANFNTGISYSPRIKGLMNSQQYLQMRREAFSNDNKTPNLQSAPDLFLWDTTRHTDWQRELFGGTSQFTDASVALVGGNAQTVFRFGIGVNHQTTVFPGDFSYSRGTGNLSVTHTSENRKFRADIATNYGFDNNNLFGGSNQLVSSGINMVPIAPALYNPDGTLNWQLDSYGRATWENPLASTLIKHNAKNHTLVTNLNISYELLQNLRLSLRSGLARTTNNEVINTPLTSISPNNPNPQNNTYLANGETNIWNIEPQLDYSIAIGKGKLEALAGGTVQSRYSNFISFFGYNYASDEQLGDLAGADTVYKGSSGSSQYRYAAVYGRIGYRLNDKYLFNLTGRRDGSSRFGPNNQFGNFGAISAGWIFSKEKWIADKFSALSFGKLRSSYGIAGSDNIGDFGYLDSYSSTASSYQGISGLYPTALFNPDYSWETNKKLEIGLELGFLQDRYSLSVSWYRNRSSNQLVGYLLPAITGFTTVNDNLNATVQNTGWEISALVSLIKKSNFSWRSSFNMTVPNSELIAFPGLETSPYNQYYVVGQPVTIAKVYHSLGINSQTGIYDFLDANGNGFIRQEDQQSFINQGRRFYGGINNSFSYRGFEINMLIEFVSQLNNPFYIFSAVPGSFNYVRTSGNQLASLLSDNWNNHGTSATYQRFSQELPAADGFSRVRSSDKAWQDASFARIKNISINYDLHSKMLQRLKFQSLRVFVQAQNLFTFTAFKGLDPAITNAAQLPALKTITAGINLKL